MDRWEFKKIQIEDRDWMNEKFLEAGLRGCEYCFANNFIWRTVYRIEAARADECLLIRNGKKGEKVYTFPIGAKGQKEIIERLIAEAKKTGEKLNIRGILKEDKERMEEWFPNEFEFEALREEADYIYLSKKLRTLAGKKLHGKRNHIARFKDKEDWEYEILTKENMQECLEMNEKWCQLQDCDINKDLQAEQCAVQQAFQYFEELKLTGGVLRKAKEIVAYSIGEPLTKDTYVVHIEKAFSHIQGAYPMINQQFVMANGEAYTYVNREEDMGQEGLRKAKLSYYPEILLEKYNALWIQK